MFLQCEMYYVMFAKKNNTYLYSLNVSGDRSLYPKKKTKKKKTHCIRLNKRLLTKWICGGKEFKSKWRITVNARETFLSIFHGRTMYA